MSEDIKFTMTPLGAARTFLRFRAGGNVGDDVAQDLAELIKEFCRSGMRTAIDAAKKQYRDSHPGGCEMFSKGENCECFLCKMDEMRAAVEGAE